MASEHTDIIIDWLSFTCRTSSPKEVIELLGLTDLPWITGRGRNGYRDSLRSLDIAICYSGQPGMGVWCELTGQGCRAFEALSTVGWDHLLGRILVPDIHVTRLDVAADDHQGILPLEKVVNDSRHGNYTAKARSCQINQGHQNGTPIGTTIYFGSSSSKVKIRLYDKAAEQHHSPSEHWVRCELQLRDERALRFLDVASNSTLGQTYSGVLRNYLRFLTPQKGDSNKSRWPTRPYWRHFLGAAERISIYTTPGLEYTEEMCRQYVANQAGNAIAAAIEMYGVDGFLRLINQRVIRPNPKYNELVANHFARKAAISGSGDGAS